MKGAADKEKGKETDKGKQKEIEKAKEDVKEEKKGTGIPPPKTPPGWSPVTTRYHTGPLELKERRKRYLHDMLESMLIILALSQLA